MIIEVFGESFNPDNIIYLFESPGWPATESQSFQAPYTAIFFVGEGVVKIENKTRKEVREEINKQIRESGSAGGK